MLGLAPPNVHGTTWGLRCKWSFGANKGVDQVVLTGDVTVWAAAVAASSVHLLTEKRRGRGKGGFLP